MMTEKARQLGMTSTQFRNASGLPNPQQYTTAHDIAMLGIALQEHFPKEYKYFSTRVFTYGNRHYANHNRLLGRVRGVDGIKTGYTRASGFNLVTSVTSGNRRIVAVVMGGRTGKSRNEQMASLIRRYLPKASRGEKQLLLAARKSAGGPVLAYSALPKTDVPTPIKRPSLKVADVIASASVPAPTSATENENDTVDPMTTASNPPSGWVIQVASMPSKPEAMNFLSATKSRAGNILADADGFTQAFSSKGTTYYRARFAGFDSKNDAWQTCDALKKRKITCYAILQ
jgi:D-alanyl-D-alanine carboxypeptidase